MSMHQYLYVIYGVKINLNLLNSEQIEDFIDGEYTEFNTVYDNEDEQIAYAGKIILSNTYYDFFIGVKDLILPSEQEELNIKQAIEKEFNIEINQPLKFYIIGLYK